MTYYFSLYDSRHNGLQFNQIAPEIYEKFLHAEDDYEDLNLLILTLDINKSYWVDISYNYDYWTNSADFKLYTSRPATIDGSLFYLKYNKNDGWTSELF